MRNRRRITGDADLHGQGQTRRQFPKATGLAAFSASTAPQALLTTPSWSRVVTPAITAARSRLKRNHIKNSSHPPQNGYGTVLTGGLITITFRRGKGSR
jgi:hypothetical protein